MSLGQSIFRRVIRPVANRCGVEISRYVKAPAAYELPVDFTAADRAIHQRVRPFTMTTNDNIKTLLEAVRYVHRARIPGAIVECGVWRGGSSMIAALALQELQDTSRDLYLYDTFEGMSRPTEADAFPDGTPAAQEFERTQLGTDSSDWCRATLEDVTANLHRTGYPADRLHFIRGKVEDTIPGTLPGQIALLRLDTDWYDSTKHELEHLYPLLAPHGILIIDDYGYWSGARRATDEYFAARGLNFYLHRADQSSRVIVKSPAPSP